jgi:sensor domain CHASE-containing protein
MGNEVMVLLISVGIPVVCGTLIVLESIKRRDQRKRMKMQGTKPIRNDRESEIIEEVYQGLKSLRARIENLETLNQGKRDKE